MLKIFRVLLMSSLIVLSCFSQAQNLKVTVVNPQGVGVEDLVVYLTPLDSEQTPVMNNKPLVITQKDQKFIPYVTVTQKGQQLSFQNKDDITHHIYSVSGDNRFSFKLRSGEEENSHKVEHVGEVAMGCNIHDWMSGYVLVVDTPYYNQTNTSGETLFDLAQAGQYKLVVWHPQLTTDNYRQEQIIEVTTDTQTWQVTLTAPLSAIPDQESQDEFDFIEGY